MADLIVNGNGYSNGYGYGYSNSYGDGNVRNVYISTNDFFCLCVAAYWKEKYYAECVICNDI